ncbi:MAG: glycosyltransferase [Bacteroidales bacterium]|nr:glycosyltransferase [Bacteroidales bacterium]
MLSVIIPVYNAENFVCKCLHSLLNQTLKDMEIIVVDDKGPDNSIQRVRELKGKTDTEDRIKILEMPCNSGAAAARNYGLQHAKGEYVAFVDSDDWCEPTMYEVLYNAAINGDCDWCYSNIIKDYPNNKHFEVRQPNITSGILTPAIRKIMLTRFVAYFTTSIYKRSFLTKNNITFPSYRFSEDSYFVWLVVMHAQKFASVNEIFYHYIIQPDSVTNTNDSTKHQQKIEVFSLLIKQLMKEQMYLPYKEELDYLCIKKGVFIPLIICAIHTNKNLYREIKAILQSAESLIPGFQNNTYLKKNIPMRLLFFIAKHSPRLFRIIMKIYSKNKKEMF